jgi:hypothetical protein
MLRLRVASRWLVNGTLLLALPAMSQQIEVPREPAPRATSDPVYKVFDAQHLKDIPYNGALPKPAYPSTDRVQRTFTVEYVYDYAYSEYKPAVSIPIVPAVQVKRDTPEAALIALDSAARTGNYEAFVACFDDAAKTRLRALATEQKQGAAYWQEVWKQFFGTKPIILIDRIETIGYVILDSRFGSGPYTEPFPTIFKSVGGQWLVTDDLGQNADQMLMSFRPSLAGEIERVQPRSTDQLTGTGRQEAEAQAEFIHSHALRNESAHAAQ